MSGVAVILALLQDSAALTAKVPASRIQAGELPLKTQLPAISVTMISSVDRHVVKQDPGAGIFTTERVQVTVLAASYPKAAEVSRLVRCACQNTRGQIAGVKVDSILMELEGPDFFDDQITMVGRSRDFIVAWIS